MKHRRFGSALLIAAALSSGIGALDVTSSVTLAAKAVAAEDYIKTINDVYRPITPDHRSDTILLPLLAKMEPPPKSVATVEQAALLPAKSPDFSAAAAWAQAPAQQALLAGLKKVTQESDWKKAYAFGQPYGAEGATPELIQAKMYTELGDPPMLAAAQHLYLPAMTNMASLVNVEATRLAAEGKPSDAIDLLINFSFFARQMADRQFYDEVAWGLQHMASAMERARDIAYTDLKGAKAIDTARIRGQIQRLVEENLGYMDVDRIKFPIGNRLAAEQILARIYDDRGNIDTQVFATTMSRLGSADHPLRLFSEAAQWTTQGRNQAHGFEAIDKAKGVYADFERRWRAPFFDPRRLLVSDYSKLGKGSNAAIDATTPDMTQLIDMRQLARVELAGTRQSLALVGFVLTNNNIPIAVTAVRPAWIPNIEVDPYNMNIQRGAKPPFDYRRPMETPKDPREVARPHNMQVFSANGDTNFQVSLLNDTFLLFSLGTDTANDGARRIQNTHKIVQNADYLIYPPVLSLHRQYLIDRGDIKVSE